jgi:hypothetical protein
VHDDRSWLPELYRLDGLRTPGPAGVDLLRRAVATAEQQGSVALLRRATEELARRAPAGTDTERSANAPVLTLPGEPGQSRPAQQGSIHDHDSTAGPL